MLNSADLQNAIFGEKNVCGLHQKVGFGDMHCRAPRHVFFDASSLFLFFKHYFTCYFRLRLLFLCIYNSTFFTSISVFTRYKPSKLCVFKYLYVLPLFAYLFFSRTFGCLDHLTPPYTHLLFYPFFSILICNLFIPISLIISYFLPFLF